MLCLRPPEKCAEPLSPAGILWWTLVSKPTGPGSHQAVLVGLAQFPILGRRTRSKLVSPSTSIAWVARAPNTRMMAGASYTQQHREFGTRSIPSLTSLRPHSPLFCTIQPARPFPQHCASTNPSSLKATWSGSAHILHRPCTSRAARIRRGHLSVHF